MKKLIFTTMLCAIFALTAHAQKITQGELNAVSADGKQLGFCPLKHTDVKAEISGFVSRVKVTQEFENNFADKIEAVYVFPLPNAAAVDSMSMRIGERTVRGKILRREEARQVYETAKNNGQIASLLDQERTNIFTQSVANILPGEKVVIEISYVETLKYEDGQYEFVFPMVVGPRYVPGKMTDAGVVPDTTRVPDASKITPPIAPDRAGHDISLEVTLDAGVVLEKVESTSHAVESTMLSASSYAVKLRNEKTIPNKDFILRYDVSGKKIGDAVLTHRNANGGFFTLILQPPDAPRVEEVTPKEIVFVLDTSGSMSGFPIEKAKESMRLALDGLNPRDTFNLITFAGETSVLFDKPVPASTENLEKAQAFLATQKGSGGTEMMKAIKVALDPTDSQEHIRIVCFMTDGYIGNEAQILSEIQKHPNARVFSFGIGSSVNRMLLDKMAEEGRGDVEYVTLEADGAKAAKRFHERVRSPLLTDISIDFGGLDVADVYPQRIGDLFSAKPVVIHGRYKKAGSGVIKVKGKSFGRETVREIAVNLPENEPSHDVLATLWARKRVDELTKLDYQNLKPEIREQITSLGLEFRLMTQFTSFVAVEERVVTEGGQPRRIDVPVESPEGVKREAVSLGEVQRISSGNFKTYPLMTATVDVSSDVRSIDMTTSGIVTVVKPDELSRGDGRGYGNGQGGGEKDRFVIDRESSDESKGVTNRSSISGRAVSLPKPLVAPSVSWTGDNGLVKVRVLVDQSGRVTEAKAETGSTELRAAAEKAALKSVFSIKQPKDDPVNLSGLVTYSFNRKGKKVDAAITVSDFAVKLTPEQVKRRLVASKSAPAVLSAIERVRLGTAAAADESRFVRNGKAEVVIRLTDLKQETIAVLKAMGVEIVTDVASVTSVVARVPVEKLATVAEFDAVKFISPQY